MVAQGKAAQQPQPWVTEQRDPLFSSFAPRERRMTKKASARSKAKFTSLMLNISKHKRYQRLHLAPINWIRLRKMPLHHPLFLAELDPKTERDQRQANEAAQLPDVHRRAREHHQQPRVNGMPHKAIRPPPHQFMIALKRYIAAPISRERETRPQREPQTANANHRTGDFQCLRARQDLAIELPGKMGKEQQPPAQPNRQALRQRGRGALRLNRRLRAKRRHEPDQEKNAPARNDDFTFTHRMKLAETGKA